MDAAAMQRVLSFALLILLLAPRTDVRAGLEAAFASANEASLVRFVLASLDDGGDDGRQASNTQQLLCSGANGTGPAFAIAGSVGSSASEAALGTLLASAGSDGVPVPFVGALTSSEKLRARASVLQSSRTGVVLARAGGGDEISAIVSFLSDSWSLLNRTSVFYEDTPFARDAVGFLSGALRSTGGAGLLSSAHSGVVTSQDDLSAIAVKAADALCARGDPAAVVLLAVGSMSAAVMQEMARRNKTGLLYIAMSFVSYEELYKAAPSSTWETVDSQGSMLFITQVVPLPYSSGSKFRVISEYQKAMRQYHPGMTLTHASLEGFIAGRLLTTAASRALELNGWPLTRATFLDAIFRDIRTFQLYGSYTLGPYGDGVGHTGSAQTSDDWCNQGAHEIWMTEFDLGWGALWPVDTWSFKFSGCGVARWNDTTPKSLIGYNAGIGDALDTLIGRNSVAIAALPENGVNRSLDLINKGKLRIPLIAPFSGLRSLRTPFTRGVVNLFASYYQEARTAGSLLAQKHNADRIAVLWSSLTHHDAGKDFAEGLALCRDRNLFGVARTIQIVDQAFSNNQSVVVDYAVAKAQEGFSFIIVAGASDAWQLVDAIRGSSKTSPIVLTSVVSLTPVWIMMYQNQKATAEWENVYRTSVTPQIASLSSSNAVRQDFENWASFMDQAQEPFEGFLIGRFISTVIESMKEEGMSSDVVTAETLLDAVYSIKYFKIDNKITVGPFLDQNSGERLCNQGMDTVYVTRWNVKQFDLIDFAIQEERRCGKEFDPPAVASEDNTERTVILSTTIPGFAIVCSLLAVAVVARSRGRSALKKIKRSELEIGEHIGKGQYGAVHNGDWHGTPVAIRVIDKTSITREDLDSIKSEMALTHSLQHPNLMMVLGYSESKTDLLVVSEYMASGSLHEYLKKNKQNMNYYNEVAIAFPTYLTIAMRENDAEMFGRALVEIAGSEFAARVASFLADSCDATSPYCRNRTSAKTTPAPVPTLPTGALHRNTNSSLGRAGGRTLRTRIDAKESALFKRLAFQTYFSMHELETIFQEFSDIVGDEPFSDKHMKMFFTQHGLTPRLIDLIVESIGWKNTSGNAQKPLPPPVTKEREVHFCSSCIQALSILEKGTNDERMYFYFRLFDLNGDGVLQPDELRVFSDIMLEHYHKASGVEPGSQDTKAVAAIEVLLAEITGDIIKDHTGGIKVEDILHHHKLLRLWEMLKILDNPGGGGGGGPPRPL
eukprot:m51a1_g4275 hypothetical protein (1231) ;mRNA; r:312095-318578